MLCFLFFSCKKNQTFNFPKGKWLLTDFAIDHKFYPSFKVGTHEEKYKYLLGNCYLSYEGSNKLIFEANGEKEIFKIKELNMSKDSICFINGEKQYFGFNFYRLSLKNKKGKHYDFQYCLINDSILIGEFWEKGQPIVRYDLPNVAEVPVAIQNSYGDYVIKSEYTELFGVFEKN